MLGQARTRPVLVIVIVIVIVIVLVYILRHSTFPDIQTRFFPIAGCSAPTPNPMRGSKFVTTHTITDNDEVEYTDECKESRSKGKECRTSAADTGDTHDAMHGVMHV